MLGERFHSYKTEECREHGYNRYRNGSGRRQTETVVCHSRYENCEVCCNRHHTEDTEQLTEDNEGCDDQEKDNGKNSDDNNKLNSLNLGGDGFRSFDFHRRRKGTVL